MPTQQSMPSGLRPLSICRVLLDALVDELKAIILNAPTVRHVSSTTRDQADSGTDPSLRKLALPVASVPRPSTMLLWDIEVVHNRPTGRVQEGSKYVVEPYLKEMDCKRYALRAACLKAFPLPQWTEVRRRWTNCNPLVIVIKY